MTQAPPPGKSTASALPVGYWLFFGGQTASAFGSSFTTYALPLLVFRQTGSPLALGATLAVSYLPYLLLGLLIGALTDRFDRKRLMVGTDLCAAAVLALIPVLGAFGAFPLAGYLVAAFLLTTLRIAFNAGQAAAVRHLVAPEQLVRANGRLQAGVSTTDLVGPLAAGVAVTVMPAQTLLLVDAASFVLSAILLTMVRGSFQGDRRSGAGERDGRRVRAAVATLRADVAEGLRFVLSHPVLRAIALLMLLANFLGASAPAQLVALAKQHLDVTDTQLSWLYTAGSAGAIGVSLAAERLSGALSFRVVTLGSQIAVGVCIAVLGLSGWYPLTLAAWAGVGAFSVLFNINTLSLRQRITPDHLLGRVMTTSMVLAWCAVPVGSLLGGALASWLGSVAHVYTITGVLSVLLGACFLLSALGRPAETDVPARTAPAAAAAGPSPSDESAP